MNTLISYSRSMITSLLFSSLVLSCQETNDNMVKDEKTIWYNNPAAKWIEALPIGNGRLGAMVYGGTESDTIQINDESLWGGVKINDNNPGSAKVIDEVQQFLLEGKILEGTKLAEEHMIGKPHRLRSYQTFMDLILDYGKRSITEYKRQLDLINGICKVQYKSNGAAFTQEAFVSSVKDVLVIRLESEANFDVAIQLDRIQDARANAVSDNELLLSGQIIDETLELSQGPLGAHMKFAGRALAIIDSGQVQREKNRLKAKGIKSLTLLVTTATNYDYDKADLDPFIDPEELTRDILDRARTTTFENLKQEHGAWFNKRMKRARLQLAGSNYDSIPTDRRLKEFHQGKNKDLGLINTYFQFGRYLLLSSSSYPGRLPANLQGIWNKDILAPWNSDYHTNINLQMNYWPTEVCNLPETIIPLTNFVENLIEPGQATAKEMFGVDQGWVVNHCTDVFGRTAIHDGPWGIFPLAGAWMTLPLWRHYEFTQDRAYLKERAWPAMKGAVEFALAFLVEDENGNLITVPSQSPENAYIEPVSKKALYITLGSTMDMQIVRELFHNCLEAIRILGKDEYAKLAKQITEALPRLLPTSIGQDGTVKEWYDDYEEKDPQHRHVSHLFGLFPGTQISNGTTLDLFEASERTLERRGDQGTGWSLAWKINFWARLQNGNHAYKILKALLKPVSGEGINMKDGGGTYGNLFCAHPPFQIDGNFGGTAGIAEMLVQSHNGKIELLPALPDAWQSGKVKGLRARAGFEVDIEWESGKLSSVEITSDKGGTCTIKYRQDTLQMETEKGKTYRFDPSLELIK